MGSLYVDGTIDEIRADGKSLVLFRGGRREGRVPMVPLERVVIQGNLRVETRALGLLAREGVAVHLLSGRQGRWQATVVGPGHAHAELRVAQLRAHLDAGFCGEAARRWIREKIEGQASNVVAWMGQSPRDRKALVDARVALGRAAESLEGAGPESVRGIEGASARAYFGAMVAVLPPALGFRGRNRRPPTDPVNALLSLSYTLVHAEWAHRLRLSGFDPYVGFFHGIDYGRESLASDLVEPVRPEVDRWVVELVRSGAFRPRDFSKGGERAGCWLKTEARRRYYAAYEQWAEPRRPAWRQRAYDLAREVLERFGGGEKGGGRDRECAAADEQGGGGA